VITALSALGCVLAMVNSYLVARGRLRAVYVVGIACGVTYVLINLRLAADGQAGVLFLVIPSAWGGLMCLLGLRRLRRERLTKAAP
jgi:hypothetical protein